MALSWRCYYSVLGTTISVSTVWRLIIVGCCHAAAFDYLCDHIGSANLEQLVGASGGDVDFLSDILNDPVYAEIIQVSILCGLINK